MRTWLIQRRGNKRQEDVAQLAGISRGAYSNIEIGKRDPSVNVAKRIANALDFEWTLFFDEDVVETKQKANSA